MRDLGWIANFSLQSPPIPNLPSPLIRDGDGDDDFLNMAQGGVEKPKAKSGKRKRVMGCAIGVGIWVWN